jgi:sarcosine oxidase subunit gamma
MGRITLKGDLAALADPVRSVTGAAIPARLRFEEGEGGRAAWMAPDELLLSVPPEAVPEALARLEADLAGSHALVADVSDMRAAFVVEGPGARDVLAKAVPIDLRPAAFGPGAFRRTRLAQVAAAVACIRAGRFEVLVFRSVAAYAEGVLRIAADPAAPLGLHATAVEARA